MEMHYQLIVKFHDKEIVFYSKYIKELCKQKW